MNRSLSTWAAVILGMVAAAALVAPLWFLFVGVWGQEGVDQGQQWLVDHYWEMIGVLVVSAVVHELLHAAGWAWAGRVPWHTMRFGVHWLTLSPYAHVTVPIPARAYRFGAALPGLVLGLAPVLAALLTGSPALWVYGLLMLVAAGGDVVALAMLWGVPGHWLVEDQPNRVGVRIQATNA